METKPTSDQGHGTNCCADVFGAKGPGGTAADAQNGFGAMMRAAQSGGVLDAKTKELILFSLVVQTRCGPCFDAHYNQARQLGITDKELEEAAWCAIAMGGAPVRMFYLERLKHLPRPPGSA